MRRRRDDTSERSVLEINAIDEKQNRDGTIRLIFRSSDGDLEGVYHKVDDAEAAVVMVGGTGGGFTGPASSYADLARELESEGVSSIRLDYRYPAELEDCIVDVIIALHYLVDEGYERLGVLGWSFGGAVVISAAAMHENVKAVATVATQSYGADLASRLEDRPILLLHGADDATLPVSSSQYVHQIASGPKELKVYEKANHGLDQVRDEMLEALRQFFVNNL